MRKTKKTKKKFSFQSMEIEYFDGIINKDDMC